VALVGLLDLLGVARSVIQQPEWLGVPGGVNKEVLLFVGVVYFIFSYGMSFASRRVEAQLRAGQR
jgi:general L-amino acid transport system permease protein